ncbi:MAG TPA: pyridoxal phosphate-dependent aminotransferase, partial [Limnochordia bacterium]
MRLASRVQRIAPSATMMIDATAKRMRQQGVDIIAFGVGEPDFDTPLHVKEAAERAMAEGFTKYTPAGGIPELRHAVCEWLAREHGAAYDPAEVIITGGAKLALHLAFQALLEPGDEVIVPAPYWVSYVEQVRLADGIPVVVATDEAGGFELSPDAVRAALTPRTRAIVINSPANPTGAVYRRETLAALAALAVERGLFIISDEIYEPFVYGTHRHTSIVSLGDALRAQALLIHGVSKSHAMTGWRIGFAVGPRALIDAMISLQSHTLSCATSIAQRAALA